MSNIVLRNLNSSKAEECLSEVYNADEVVGGFGFGFEFSNTNQIAINNVTIENDLDLKTKLPSLQTITQVARLPGK